MYRSLIRTSLVRQLGSKVPSRIISRGYSSGFSRGFTNQNRMIAGFAGIGAGLVGVGLAGSSFAIQNDVDQEKFDDEFKQALEDTKKELEDVKKALEEAELAEKSEQESEETSYEGAAYNPETGEINWDCPCLGGMADGPCGEEFKEAFACFVYSETDPKGIDCIKKFENMRSCFKKYPEHYKAELYEGDEPEGEVDAATPAEENSEAPVSETAK